MKQTSLLQAVLLSVLVFTAGCQPGTLSTVKQQVTAEKISIATPDQALGTGAKVLEIPFVLQSVPQDARLVLDFRVMDKGHCLVTYEPTTVWVNGIKVREIDFRDFERLEKRRIEIALLSSCLRRGDNLVRLRTGECQYDIDVMRFNEIILETR